MLIYRLVRIRVGLVLLCDFLFFFSEKQCSLLVYWEIVLMFMFNSAIDVLKNWKEKKNGLR